MLLALQTDNLSPLWARDKPLQNSDGSTDIYFGPQAPNGKEQNWLKTVPQKGFFIILRLYSPAKAAINKSWKPDDLVRIN